jgi:hypothetical protein
MFASENGVFHFSACRFAGRLVFVAGTTIKAMQ